MRLLMPILILFSASLVFSADGPVCTFSTDFSQSFRDKLSKRVDLTGKSGPVKQRYYDPYTRKYVEMDINQSVSDAERAFREASYAKKNVSFQQSSYAATLMHRSHMNVAGGDLKSAITDARSAAKNYDAVAGAQKVQVIEGRTVRNETGFEREPSYVEPPRDVFNAMNAHTMAGDVQKAADYVARDATGLMAQRIEQFGIPKTSSSMTPKERVSTLWNIYNQRRLQAELYKRAGDTASAQYAARNAAAIKSELESASAALR